MKKLRGPVPEDKDYETYWGHKRPAPLIGIELKNGKIIDLNYDELKEIVDECVRDNFYYKRLLEKNIMLEGKVERLEAIAPVPVYDFVRGVK